MWVIIGAEVLDINDTTAAWFHTGCCYNRTETGTECGIMQGEVKKKRQHLSKRPLAECK